MIFVEISMEIQTIQLHKMHLKISPTKPFCSDLTPVNQLVFVDVGPGCILLDHVDCVWLTEILQAQI